MENPSYFNGLDNVSVWLPKPWKIFPYFLTVSEAKKEKVFTPNPPGGLPLELNWTATYGRSGWSTMVPLDILLLFILA